MQLADVHVAGSGVTQSRLPAYMQNSASFSQQGCRPMVSGTGLSFPLSKRPASLAGCRTQDIFNLVVPLTLSSLLACSGDFTRSQFIPICGETGKRRFHEQERKPRGETGESK